MYRLTKKQELAYLTKAYEEGDYIDRGSSRAVFDLKDGFVLKIAMDSGGQYQNHNEVKAFRSFGDNKNLAAVKCYGKYVVVMEKVKVLCSDEVQYIYEEGDNWFGEKRLGEIDLAERIKNELELKFHDIFCVSVRNNEVIISPERMKASEISEAIKVCNFFGEEGSKWMSAYEESGFVVLQLDTMINPDTNDAYSPYIYNDEECQDIIKTVDFLCMLNGETEDNYQVGMTVSGKVVAYDYGFVESEHSKSVSRKLWRLGDEDDMRKVTEGLIIKMTHKKFDVFQFVEDFNNSEEEQFVW